ncbi:MAG: PliI family lysozyme inhibitor of I-type lysozyme [Fluviibacter sp.]
MHKTTALLFALCLTTSSIVWAADFEQTLELQGISFKVHATNKGSINTLTIKPKGLKRDNKPITREINGTVVEAEVADLDADGSPEILVYTTSAGSGSYGGFIGYAANHKKSLSMIFMPDIMDDKEASAGYMGHDEFSVVETRLARRFPIYRPGDTNSNPTGGLRQLYYVLTPGEAGWVLKLDEIVNFAPEDLAEN